MALPGMCDVLVILNFTWLHRWSLPHPPGLSSTPRVSCTVSKASTHGRCGVFTLQAEEGELNRGEREACGWSQQ